MATRLHLLTRFRHAVATAYQVCAHHAERVGDGVLFVAALMVAGLGTNAQLFDRDEPRYAEATRQMVRTGDWVVPMFNGQPRDQKPPAIYWLQAIPVAVFGPREWALRLPSVLFTALTCVLIARFTRRVTAHRRAGWLAAGSYLLCCMTLIESRLCTIDATLLFFTTLIMLEWYDLTHGSKATWPPKRRHRAWLGWWVTIGVAVLLKMPAIFAVFGPTLTLWLAWQWPQLPRYARQFVHGLRTHLLGLCLTAAVIALWVVPLMLRRGTAFFDVFLARDVISRAAEPAEGHSGPFFYYLPVLLLGFFPWIALAMQHSHRVFEALPRPLTLWLLCWIIGPTLALSAIATKLMHYVFPVFPALAILAGTVLDRAWRHEETLGLRESLANNMTRWASLGVLALVAVVALAIPAAVAMLGLHAVFAPALLIALTLSSGCLFLAYCMSTGRVGASCIGAAVLMALLTCMGALWAVPAFDTYKPSQSLGIALRTHVPDFEGQTVRCFGYDESSLVFYFQAGVSGSNELAKLVDALNTPPQIVLVRREWLAECLSDPSITENVRAEIVNRLERARLIARFENAFNYNKGSDRWGTLELRIVE